MRFEKAEQLLVLAERMQASSEGVSLVDIQEQFDVGRRTAERMRDAVIRIFPSVDEKVQEDKVKRWRIRSGSMGSLSCLSADDLSELQMAIDHLKRENLLIQAENLERLWLKLKGVVKPEKVSRVETDLEALIEAEGYAMRPGPRPKIEASVLYTLREAIKASQKVRITYHARVKGDIKTRIVSPYGFLYGNRHYLIALCDEADGIRTFSLSNIKSISLIEQFFMHDQNFDLREFSERSFGVFQEEPYEVVWRFRAAIANDVKEHLFHPSQIFEDQTDGSVIVRFTAGGWKEMCWHLFSWEGDVEVLAPARLKQQYEFLVRRVLEMFDDKVD